MTFASGLAIVAIAALAVRMTDGLPGRLDAKTRLVLLAEGFEPEFDRCMGRSMEDGLCSIGRAVSGEVDVLVWGDSHAGAAMGAIDGTLQSLGLAGQVAFRNACPPIIGVIRADMRRGQGCDEFNADVMQSLADRPDIRTVVLIARWALNVEGSRVAGENGRAPQLRWAEGTPWASSAETDNHMVFATAMPDTIARIRATGRRVIVLTGVPEIGWPVPQVLALHNLIGAPIPERPGRAGVAERYRRANAVFDRLAADDPGIVVLDVTDAFCATDCHVALDGRPLFRDDNHLSRFGLERLVTPALRAVLTGG